MRRSRPAPLRWLAALLAGAFMAALASSAVGVASAAGATDEFYRYPPGYVSAVTVTGHGHGYGHGRGLSQYGARGAASAGLAWQQTLAVYYPGTTRATWAGDEVAVRLDQTGTSSTYLRATPGLQITLGRPTVATAILPSTAPTGKPAVAYQILRDGLTLRIEVSDGAVWSRWDITGNGSAPAVPFVVTRPDSGPITTLAVRTGGNVPMTPTVREYRGRLVTWPGSAAGSVMTVNEVSMDLYLRSVVPSEMPSSWPTGALTAQAVAARTYAAHEAASSPSTAYDICDTTSCQVYRGSSDAGVPNEYARTNSAIAVTAGVVLTYVGKPAFTEFSASNGGYSVAGSFPYLVAKADPYDGRIPNSANTWSASIPITQIEAAYPSIGAFRVLRILSRDGRGDQGGRVLDLSLNGTAGSVQLTGAKFASTFGLRHPWFQPTNAAQPSAPAWPRDFNQDARADVMTLLGTTSGNVVTLHRGNGVGGFTGPWVRFATDFGPGARVFTAGPWDSDQTSDLLSIRSDATLWLYPGKGTSGLGTPRSLGSGWGGYRDLFGAGDVDGEGRNDLIARDADGRLFVIPGDGEGGTLGRTLVSSGWAGFNAVFSPGDFDGDGHVDLMTRDTLGRLWFYPGRGDATFGSRRLLGAGWAGYVSLTSPGDFNGDGATDVVARLWNGTLYVWSGTGKGGFSGRTSLGGGWTGYTAVLP